MSFFDPSSPWSRIAFLALLAIGISLLFFQVIKDFLLALVLAATLAGLSYPLYRRLVVHFRGRRAAASATTVVLSLILVIVPVVFFLGVLLTEALETSQKASIWVSRQSEQPDQLQRQIDAMPALQRWLPYQDQILEKAGELAGKASGFVAQQLAAGARGTASFFLMLFVMLYAMFYFLVHGRHLLRVLHRFTPLTNDDSERLLRTFVFALLGLGTLNIAIYSALVPSQGPALAALILSTVNTLMAIVIMLFARKAGPGPNEEKLAREMRDLAYAALSTDMEQVKNELAQITTDVRNIRSSFTSFTRSATSTIAPILGLLLKSGKRD